MNEDFQNSLKIIDMEDELEEIRDEIKDFTKEIKRLRKDKKDKRKLNFALSITEIIIAILGAFNTFAISATLFYMITVFIFVKLVDIKTFSSFDNINKKIHKLFLQKELLLAEHKDLENKLFKLKLYSDIKKEDNIELDNNKSINENKLENNIVKKLTLTKPNED